MVKYSIPWTKLANFEPHGIAGAQCEVEIAGAPQPKLWQLSGENDMIFAGTQCLDAPTKSDTRSGSWSCCCPYSTDSTFYHLLGTHSWVLQSDGFTAWFLPVQGARRLCQRDCFTTASMSRVNWYGMLHRTLQMAGNPSVAESRDPENDCQSAASVFSQKLLTIDHDEFSLLFISH